MTAGLSKLDAAIGGGSDDWQTPPELYDPLNEVFQFNLDAAASAENHKCLNYLTEKDDALRLNWGATGYSGGEAGLMAWLNPPYSQLSKRPWVEKVIEEASRGVTTVMLTFTKNDTRWYQQILDHASHIILLNKRVSFLRNGKPVGSPTHPSTISIFRPWGTGCNYSRDPRLAALGRVIFLGNQYYQLEAARPWVSSQRG